MTLHLLKRNNMKNNSRRFFLQKVLLGSTTLVLPWKAKPKKAPDKIQLGIIADPHQDLMHDVESRLEKFLEAAENRAPGLIIHLGDFCHPKKENNAFLSLWNQFSGPKYHVLGNHDMDTASKIQTMEYWGMISNFYSFDQNGYHFIILDANFLNEGGMYKDYEKSNFYVDDGLRTWIHPDQIDWLKEDLANSNLPTLVFSHQSLVTDLWGIKNRTIVQKLFEETNRQAGFQKVIACFNGHNHIDAYRQINGIYYIDINSMTYQWLGEKYQYDKRYSQEIYEKFPNIKFMAPYDRALFAFVTISNGSIEIEGRSGKYVGPSPADLGLTESVYGIPFTAKITSQKLSIR
jgi:hypothetical protein